MHTKLSTQCHQDKPDQLGTKQYGNWKCELVGSFKWYEPSPKMTSSKPTADQVIFETNLLSLLKKNLNIVRIKQEMKI